MNHFRPQWALVFVALLSMPSLAAELELTKEQMANVNFETTKVATRENRPFLSFTGTLVADRRKTHRVAPLVGGLLTELLVVSNERVHKGQLLARLRSHVLGQAQADYLEALARYELAEAERKRVEGLLKDGVVAESRWLKVDSEYKSARATLEARRRMLTLTGLSDKQIVLLAKEPGRLAEFDLISPIDGLVTGVEVESGQMLSAGEAAFHVDDLSTLWAMVKIPVASLAQVATGAEASIRVQASPGQLYRGTLESLGGEVEIQSQTLSGRIVLGNPNDRLRPGMYAEVILTGLARTGLTAPASAVFLVGDQPYLFKVLGKGRFEPVAVEIGAESEDLVPIISGVSEGTEIVSSGVAELKSHWQYQGAE